MKTNSGLVSYAKAQVGNPYWYGTYGNTASASLYEDKKKQYPDYYTATDFSSQYGKRVHDCVGLIKGYLWSDSVSGTPVYNSKQDVNACGMYNSSGNKGRLTNMNQLQAGQLVYYSGSGNASGISHVGVFGGDGYVYEAKGHQYGVVKSSQTATKWNFWSQCPWITDDVDSTTTTTTTQSVRASEPAMVFDSLVAGTYVTTADSQNIRDGAGTDRKILTTITKGTKLQCYGYYTDVGTTKWLYCVVNVGGVEYTAFASEKYLEKT